MMEKKLLSPKELLELHIRQEEEAKILAAKLEEENKLEEKSKRILSPKDLFAPEIELSETEEVAEIVEEPKDPVEVLQERIEEVSASIKEPKYYDKEISQVNTVIEQIKNNLQSVPEVKYYDAEIQSILEKLDSLDIRYYESDLESINEKLKQLQDTESKNFESIKLALKHVSEDIEKFYELEILDPKETHEYINSINEFFSGKLEKLKTQLSQLPEVKYYDDELVEIQEKIETVKNSIPEIPEIKYYDEELKNLIEEIVDIRSNITELPKVKYYEDEISHLEESIKEVESKISELPEIRYYDSQIDELNESITNVKNDIPEVRYYEKQIQQLEESIKGVENKILIIPEVKYYDTEISEVNDVIEGIQKNIRHIQKSVESIEIPEQVDWSGEIQSIYEEIEKLKEIPLITESADPLVPLDQKFATLDDLQNHYRLFINRVQQQLSTLGGGGETRLEFLDDVDRDSAKTHGYVLSYDSTTGKFIGTSVSGGGGGGSGIATYANFAAIAAYATTAGVSTYSSISGIATYALVAGLSTVSQGLTGSPNIDVGITTASRLIVGAGTTFPENLVVEGNARVTGILTIGTASVTIDGDNNTITTGNVLISGSSVTIGENVTINAGATGINSAPNVLYVAKDGNDSNNGTSIDNAKLTIAGAVAISTTGTTIKVLSGTYIENNPIILPEQVSIVGDSLREVTVTPQNSGDIFYVSNGNYISDISFVGAADTGSIIAFNPAGSGNITQSPYIQNCTNFIPNSIGVKVNGDHASGNTKSIVVDSYTQYNQGGIGVSITNKGYAQLVSLFTICNEIAIYCGSGGACDLTNSNSSFGNYGLVANGVSSEEYVGIITVAANANSSTFTIAGVGTNRPYDGQVVYFDDLYYEVSKITIVNGGSNYTTPPTILIDDPSTDWGIAAQAVATISNGVVSEIDIISTGRGYTTIPNVIISGGGGSGLSLSVEITPKYYLIESATLPSNGISTITITENVPYAVGVGTTAPIFKQSRILASGHSFEYIGSGVTIANALPSTGGVAIQANEIDMRNGGLIVYTSTDQSGNFRIGDGVVINQSTGSISGTAYVRSLYSNVTPLILALGG